MDEKLYTVLFRPMGLCEINIKAQTKEEAANNIQSIDKTVLKELTQDIVEYNGIEIVDIFS